jgi:hypothetical protein
MGLRLLYNDEQFLDLHNQLHELYAKFYPAHHVILWGDVNATLLQNPCPRHTRFQYVINNLGMQLCKGILVRSCF